MACGLPMTSSIPHLPPCAVDALNEFINLWRVPEFLRREGHFDLRDIGDFLARFSTIVQSERHTRRAAHRRIAEIDNIAEGNTLLPALADDQQMVAAVPDFIDQARHQKADERAAKHRHDERNEHERESGRAFGAARMAGKNQHEHDEQRQKPKPHNGKNTLKEECALG